MNLVDFDSAASQTQPVVQDVSSVTQTVLGDLVCAWVGRARLDTVQDAIKRAMLTEALARTAGNLSHAALLLGVKRQAVQQMLARYELRSWAQDVRARSRYSA